MGEVIRACRSRGLWPYTSANRLCVAPPCTTSAAELEEGLGMIDDALSVLD